MPEQHKYRKFSTVYGVRPISRSLAFFPVTVEGFAREMVDYRSVEKALFTVTTRSVSGEAL